MKQTQSQSQELIEQLLNQNNLIKEKYEKLLIQHDRLQDKYKDIVNRSQKCENCRNGLKESENDKVKEEINVVSLETNKAHEKIGELPQKEVATLKEEPEVEDDKEDIDFEDLLIHQHYSQEEKQNHQKVDEFETTSLELSPTRPRASSKSSRASSISEKVFPMIEGCFIIEKVCKKNSKNKSNLTEMLKYVYPPSLEKTEKQTLELLLKYSFSNQEIIKVQDDMENSRKNEILFGTPYEEYCFGFEDGKWATKRDLPEIMKLMGTMKKKYYHVLVKPEIIEEEEINSEANELINEEEKTFPLKEEKKDQEEPKTKESETSQENQENLPSSTSLPNEEKLPHFYETEVIFGFISSFPFRTFFQDLHRTIQQELKYSQFKTTETKEQIFDPTETRANKYKVMSEIMEKLYENQYKISRFPISHTYTTGVTKINLNIPNVITHREIEDDFLNHVLNKYDTTAISRLLHYVLTEKCVLVEAHHRKALNEIFEAIRIMIRPFMWIFAVVYVYSEYFEPFMSSPMPIIIGKVTDDDEETQENENDYKEILETSDFCVINLTEPKELKEGELFYKTIKKLKKELDSNYKARNGLDRATILHKYVHNLRCFIEKGVLNNEPTDFHIEFIETQMVSYFKNNMEI